MVNICDKDMKPSLLSYLKEEAVYNTFLLADIENYGFDKEFQTVYADLEEGKIKGVYLKFYNNFIVYSKEDQVDEGFLEQWFRNWKPEVVMGKAGTVKKMCQLLPDYHYKEEYLYLLESQEKLNLCFEKEKKKAEGTIQKGTLKDVDRIYQFLMSIDEIKALYGSRDMIEERIKTGDGFHYFLEMDGQIIGHANSAASSPYTAMIGGVATAYGERGKGIAARLVFEAAKDILNQGKTPCLFSKRDQENNVYVRLGFEKAGMWSVMTK